MNESIRDATVDGTFDPDERLRLERAGLIVSEPGQATTVSRRRPAATVGAQLTARTAANARFSAVLDGDDVDAALDAALPLLPRIEHQRFSSHAARHFVTAHQCG